VTAIVSEPSIPRWTFLPYGMTADQVEQWIENRESQRVSGSGFAFAIEAQAGRSARNSSTKATSIGTAQN
jgi:hypothetical protein